MTLVAAALQQPLSFSACKTSSFSYPAVEGLEFKSLEANVVTGVSESIIQGLYLGFGPKEVQDLSFCNVTLTYSHTGHSDSYIGVQVWLPHQNDWNERLMAVGGGGFAAGLFPLSLSTMRAAVSDGYVAVSTDGGHSPDNPDPANWALDNSGNVDMHHLENFAYRALGNQGPIAKAITKQFYGKPPKRSYWNGCSTGGRQGLAMAQRYPDTFDGILANAPAVNWAQLVASIYWPQFVLNEMGEFPHACEINAVTAAAIKECDLDDGVDDGVVADPDACRFDPTPMVGKKIDCGGKIIPVSKAAVAVAKAAWHGPRFEDGRDMWYGFSPDIALVGPLHIATTKCPDDGPCTAVTGFQPSNQWIQWFLAKSPKIDLAKMTHRDFDQYFNQSVREYNALMGTNNPDLSKFRDAGGKMVTVHGTADQLIPPKSMQEYYEKVLKNDSGVREYYRYFEAPGMAHCFGGRGGYPEHAFEDLVAWVEEGRAPDTLLSRGRPEIQGSSFERPLCQYPSVARYDGTGDIKDPKNYHCAESHLSTTPIATVIARTRRILEAMGTTVTQTMRDEV